MESKGGEPNAFHHPHFIWLNPGPFFLFVGFHHFRTHVPWWYLLAVNMHLVLFRVLAAPSRFTNRVSHRLCLIFLDAFNPECPKLLRSRSDDCCPLAMALNCCRLTGAGYLILSSFITRKTTPASLFFSSWDTFLSRLGGAVGCIFAHMKY